MHYRQSLDLSLRSRGLEPMAVLESDSSFQLIQAINAGLCCAVMPLDCGLEDLSEHMRIIPVADASIHSPVGLLLRRSEPRSAIAEQCFDEARALFQPA
ncbi:LysR substrate binding domain protein [compost metagenome]